METLTVQSQRNRYTRPELIEEWRRKVVELREQSIRWNKHQQGDLGKWYEGQADAYDRYADMLEYLYQQTDSTREP